MADFVTLRFDRKSIDALNLRAPLFALEQMIMSATTVRDFAGRVRIAFDGYDEDSEVFMDPGVQRFVRELTDLFPYWLHFADKEDETLHLLMSCLIPLRHIEGNDTDRRQVEITVSAWRDQIARLQNYMLRLHAQFRLEQQETHAICESVIAWAKRSGLDAS